MHASTARVSWSKFLTVQDNSLIAIIRILNKRHVDFASKIIHIAFKIRSIYSNRAITLSKILNILKYIGRNKLS